MKIKATTSKLITFFFISLFTCLSFYSSAQTLKAKRYKAKIHLTNYSKSVGTLYQLSDSAVVIWKIGKRNKQYLDTIHYSKINRIYITKRSAGIIGLAAGALLGFGSGYYLGYQLIEGDAISYAKFGLIWAPIPAVVGFFIGSSIGKNYKIYSDFDKFKSLKRKLSKKIYLK